MMDFSKIEPEFRKEIVRGGEAYLDGLVKLATAADARASSLAGMYTAAATGLIAGVVIALFNLAGTNLSARLPLILGGVGAAVCFLLGAMLCISAIQPADFYLPGCEPDNWKEDIDTGKKLDDCLGERAGHIQSDIDSNTEVIRKNARLFKWGSRFGIAAPFVGVLIWAITQCPAG
ncbi:hypothetical protein [Bradyrhizobium erythrophlei]|uniref:Uncharacterized protein n=1 Tax=Bradyrhizobium erythrophlei TaxID=1437360 RepID=A0A1M7TN39_9BRAD|nr:hypothetical protein [Bradyrhizobium erythrophlei]SHN72096.1 hypothetical protein SAMN05444170_2191 [Bradyrhizobium erythrophlei]